VKVANDSCGGEGVAMIKSAKDHIEFKKIHGGSELVYQEFIDYSGDYRVNVIGGKAVCAFQRLGVPNDFRANLSLGGSMEKVKDIDLLKTLYEKAEEVIKVFPGAEVVGLDFIVSKKSGEPYFLEANLSPWTRNIEEITGVNIGEKMVDYFESIVDIDNR
jgi:glutathione synthase/RimK-type ligase-like ATP-grasp enzyme